MVYKKKVSKKIINSAMNDLEDAILDKKHKVSSKKRKVSSSKITTEKILKNNDILLLTDVVEESPFYKNNSSKLLLKNNIKSIVESDINIWINNNLKIVSDKYVKEAINSISYNDK